MIASTAMSAIGAIQQGEAQKANYTAQAQANDYQATVNRNNALVASQQANAQEEAQRRHFGALQGQTYAGIAQSNTGFDGSNSDVLKQNAINNELDALTIRYEGDNKSKGLMAQAGLDTYNAGVNRMNASNAQTSGYLNAGSALLTGATRYSYYNTTGKMMV